MKKTLIFFSLFSCILIACSKGLYKDGCYIGKSQASYDNEPYVGYVTLSIKDGCPIKVEFQIIDTTKNESVNDKYVKYFEENEHYIKQCRNDWKGIQIYPCQYLKKHDLEKVDAISGATWSFNFFNYAAIEALKKAKK